MFNINTWQSIEGRDWFPTNLSPRTHGHATPQPQDFRLPALFAWIGGEYRIRTDDPLRARQVLQPTELIPQI